MMEQCVKIRAKELTVEKHKEILFVTNVHMSNVGVDERRNSRQVVGTAPPTMLITE